MATVTHTIYSHYDPKDHEKLERQIGQLEDRAEAEESWKTEPPKYRNWGLVPRFVAATAVYDSSSFSQPTSSCQKTEKINDGVESETVEWYRSLRRELDEDTTQRLLSAPAAASPPNTSSSTQTTSASVAEKRDKNNWFIMNAMNTIKSEPPSTSIIPRPPPPTLADILARDPPPKPNERKYTPPVWLEIGPSNKGFAMLQKSGWNEGEALGPDVVRRQRPIEDTRNDMFSDGHATDKSHLQPGATDKGKRKGEITAPISDMNRGRGEDVIDLTLSDSDSEREDDVDDGTISPAVKFEFLEREEQQDAAGAGKRWPEERRPDDQGDTASSSPKPPDTENEDDPMYGRRALLTPLATVLKSDRLGIGLKAKMVGPYKASRKRVTHNAAALAAHIRTAEDVGKKKKELGRGRRGFERQYRKEMMKRQMMLAYMNS
ncbi:hypothetical protein AX15_002403 [Amanita polypyramis BW_CC]|nr:hypothetical protein AX15_002403 [Amanita polypyramis BW_CC]